MHKFHDTHCQRAVIQVDWQSKFLHPVLQCLGISHGQQQRLLLNILIGWIIGEKHIPGETFGGWGCSVLLAWEGLTSNYQDQKKRHKFSRLVSFGFSTLGMAVSSTHQCGMSNWQVSQFSHTSMFLIEGSDRKFPLPPMSR